MTSLLKPENVLVDYTENNGQVTNFSFVLGDWGTAGNRVEFFGGTPTYASPNAFRRSEVKDIFAFGIVAAELYFDQTGKDFSKNGSALTQSLLM